ncbi:DNRLRE domain-containing protein [Polyangium aurulentum]|uniref:DNRLRE domain-containing protein n=1 Tax=Polyangium aurulentum TaxID=2567896 RepID=UPI00146CA85A|nr:DNRLRE domain-containing protein [Polyangium aurulentum]UQA62022.1 DNRLRE domain-containing protein [Polyangium aurulentum]
MAVLVPAILSVSGCGADGETTEDDARIGSAVQAQTTPICVTIQRGVFGTVEDAQIASEQPAKNYGTKTLANVGAVGAGVRQSLFRFDLGAIPATATVTSAKLTLTAYQSLPLGSSATLRAHRILSPWTEGTVTWGLFNASFSPAVDASAINDRPSPATATFDLTALAQAWVSGASANHGVLLEQPETTTTNISTSETATASHQPALQVCYLTPDQVCTPDFATWSTTRNHATTLSSDKRTAISTTQHNWVQSDVCKSSGKWYVETTKVADGSPLVYWTMGVASASATSFVYGFQANDNTTIYYFAGGVYAQTTSGNEATLTSSAGTLSLNQVLGIALDMDNRQITFRTPTATSGPYALPGSASAYCIHSGYGHYNSHRLNAGQDAFYYPVPAGFTPGLYGTPDAICK